MYKFQFIYNIYVLVTRYTYINLFTRVYNFLLRVCVHTAEVPMLCIYFRYGVPVWCH
jgi:hypothetical protein